MSDDLRCVSYGGGVQSTALLVLAAQGRIDFPLFLFANVGDDSEHPDTLRYVREVAAPYAEAHGIELVELHRIPTKGADAGQVETLYGRLMAGRLAIPYRKHADGPPMTRQCTVDFKIEVVRRELRRRGATVPAPAEMAIGISVDEIERAKPGLDPRSPELTRTYPLLDLGLARHHCAALIAAAGLPVPGRSACWFCPHHGTEAWRRLRRETPDLFDRACQLEADLTERRGEPVYLTRRGRPLAETVDDQLVLDGMDGCDSGWCMT